MLDGFAWDSLAVLGVVVVGYGVALTTDSAPTSTAITLVVDALLGLGGVYVL